MKPLNIRDLRNMVSSVPTILVWSADMLPLGMAEELDVIAPLWAEDCDWIALVPNVFQDTPLWLEAPAFGVSKVVVVDRGDGFRYYVGKHA